MIDFLSDDSDDELLAALEEIRDELNRRDAAPYDGVLGCPPDSITGREKDRFISVRNRLLDGEKLSLNKIRALIGDCNTNSESFKRIPDRLKEDIRFLHSIWNGAKSMATSNFYSIWPNNSDYITVREIPELTAKAIYPKIDTDADNINYWALVNENKAAIHKMMIVGELKTLDPLTYRQDSGMIVGDAGLNRLVEKEEYARLCGCWGINFMPRPEIQHILPLIPLNEELRQNYIDNAYEWDMYQAIFILQGYKPPEQDLSNQTAGHFAHIIDYFSRAARSGEVGRKVIHCGENNIVDSPENWLAFWGKAKINQANQAEAQRHDNAGSQDKSVTITTRTIPERLMPDANYQFVINRPFELVFDPDKPLPLDREPIPSDFVQPELDEWFLYDSWGIKLACKLITLGYPVCLDRLAEKAKDWPHDCEGRDRFGSMVHVYERALGIAASSVKAGTIKEHDTPANWIAWAKSKGYSVAHLISDYPQSQAESVGKEAIATEKPWLIANPNDPPLKQGDQAWFTPARYFARDLVKNDSTLLTKRDILASKVADSLKEAGIKKRGGKKDFNPTTILKALSNVKFT